LEVALENGLKTIAFPSISTGAYGYPFDCAAEVAVTTVKTFLEETVGIELVRFVLFNQSVFQAFDKAMKKVWIG